MSDPVQDPNKGSRGEQPLHAPGDAVSAATSAAHRPPVIDGPAPPYTAPYPPYPYDPPAKLGMAENLAAGLAYVTVIPAVLFLLLEPYRHNQLIRFHSWQSIFLFIALAAVRSFEKMLSALLPSAVAFFFGGLVSLVFFVAWLIVMIKAFQGSKYLLPVVGRLAESTAASSSVS